MFRGFKVHFRTEARSLWKRSLRPRITYLYPYVLCVYRYYTHMCTCVLRIYALMFNVIHLRTALVKLKIKCSFIFICTNLFTRLPRLYGKSRGFSFHPSFHPCSNTLPSLALFPLSFHTLPNNLSRYNLEQKLLTHCVALVSYGMATPTTSPVPGTLPTPPQSLFVAHGL